MIYDSEYHFSLCKCRSDEHTIQWRYDPNVYGSDWPFIDEVYFSVFLNDYPGFWGRVKRGIKYIFGYKSKYGHFDCYLLGKDDARKLVDFLQNTYLKPKPMSINDVAGDSHID